MDLGAQLRASAAGDVKRTGLRITGTPSSRTVIRAGGSPTHGKDHALFLVNKPSASSQRRRIAPLRGGRIAIALRGSTAKHQRDLNLASTLCELGEEGISGIACAFPNVAGWLDRCSAWLANGRVESVVD